ncbi:MAG: Fic family protein [Candidatus Zixiibacteriota bacterium]|nr:MAG: Fic family protein [candidate division Zixibacteria bacterium]
MDKAFKNRTKEHFFALREKLEALPIADRESTCALRRCAAINSSAIDMSGIDPVFLEMAPDRIPDRKWERISSAYQSAMIETQALLQACERIEETAASKTPLNITFLLQLHRSVFERTQYSAAGRFRSSRNLPSLTGHELPHHSRLPELVDHHLSWLNHRLSIFSNVTMDNFLEMFHIAAEGIYRFADSLPFECGTGRFGRAVGDYVFLFTGLYHLVISYDKRDEYADVVSGSAIDNLAPLVNFLVASFAATLDRIDGFVQLSQQASQDVCRKNIS